MHSYKKVIYDRIDDADVKVSYISELLNVYGRTLDENETLSETLNENETLKLTENEKAVLRVVVRNEDATQKDISRETNLAVSTVKRLMGNLQEKGILVRRGLKRTGTWHIKINY